jgi:hypothetical protein
MLGSVYGRVQAAEDTRRTDETTAVLDAEIGRMRGAIESVTTYCSQLFTEFCLPDVYCVWGVSVFSCARIICVAHARWGLEF